MTLFEPKNGHTPQWRVVYDLAVKRNPGDLITYPELTEALGYDPRVGPRGPIHTASEKMLETHDRALVSVRGQGYRVALATEHYGLAKGKQRQARRRITQGIALAVHVDVSQLDQKQRAALDGLSQVLMAQNAMLSRHSRQISTIEQTVSQVDDRVAVLEGLLRARGIDVPGRVVVEGEVGD